MRTGCPALKCLLVVLSEVDNARMNAPSDSSALDFKHRWFYRPPLGVLVGLLAFEALLLLADRLRWFTYEDNGLLRTLLACGGVAALFIRPAALLVRSSIRRCLPILQRVRLAVWRFFRGRRWYQFSLRSLLVFTLILGAAGGWLGKKIEQKRRERLAVEAIRKAGSIASSFNPSGPRWLQSVLGENLFSEVDRVDVMAGDDTVLAQLDPLRDVVVLNIAGSRITERGLNECLDHLKDLPRLRTLCVGGVNNAMSIGDSALRHIKDLTQLEELGFIDNNMTDNAFENIEMMTHLRKLYLEKVPITGTGLIHIKGLTRLQSLCLMGTNVNDDGLVHLKDMIGLRELSLWNTLVTDAGLVNLKEMSCLWCLQLNGIKVTDAGLASLRDLKQLRRLEIAGTWITAGAVDEFQKALPECEVVFGPSASPLSKRPLAGPGAP